MQTIKDKWKYKLQQLFETLSLSLATGLESFNGPVNDGQFAVSRDLNHVAASVQPARVLRAAAWCGCCHRNRTVGTKPISSFSNAINPQLNADAFCEKSFITGVF